MERIAIDMDEVIADALERHLEWYNQEFNARLEKSDVYGNHIDQIVVAEHRSRVKDYPNDQRFFQNLPVIEDSQQVIRELSERYEIFITTAALEYPTSFTAKYEWLQEHFSFIPWTNIVFCGDKSIIAADYLIDDNVRHFRRFRGEGIIFTAPHNVHELGYRRVDTWQAVRAMFL